MISTAVVVPHPPLLVPELAGTAADETGDLRDACLAGGRVPWQVLAGAMPAARSARLVHSSAPFGVAYHVAVWQR